MAILTLFRKTHPTLLNLANCNLFWPYFRSTGELTSNYLKGKEDRISSFLSDNEFEQIDFVRSLIQHMNHYQLGTIDNDLQVQLWNILKNFKIIFSAIITTRFYQSAGEARNVRISEKYSWLSWRWFAA